MCRVTQFLMKLTMLVFVDLSCTGSLITSKAGRVLCLLLWENTVSYLDKKGIPQGDLLSTALLTVTLIELPRLLPKTIHLMVYAGDICIRTSTFFQLYASAQLQNAGAIIQGYLAYRIPHTAGISSLLERVCVFRASDSTIVRA